MPLGRACPLPWAMSSGWRVRLVTDGSVSRHLNKKSWPSLTLGLEREVTKTVEESAGSVREAAEEEEEEEEDKRTVKSLSGDPSGPGFTLDYL